MTLTSIYTGLWTLNILLAGVTTPPQNEGGAPAVPGVREAMEYSTWLSRQSLSVWFALLTMLFGVVIYLIIKHLLRTLDREREAHAGQMKDQRDAHTLQIREMREEFANLQKDEKALSLSLLQYLERDHTQTVVLVRDNQSIMSETVTLLKAIQQDRHDDKLLREKNHELLNKIDKSTNQTSTL